MKIGYFKNFGTKELLQLQTRDNNHLLAYSQDDLLDALKDKEIDLAITDPRDDDYSDVTKIDLVEKSIIVLLQADNFEKNQQTINLDELSQIPNIIIAKPEEEATELHYHKDLLKIKSPFLAVDSFNEAALMAESGSGYFLMNELTANSFNSLSLQKMFLLSNGKQLKQRYIALCLKKTQEIDEACQQLKQILNED